MYISGYKILTALKRHPEGPGGRNYKGQVARPAEAISPRKTLAVTSRSPWLRKSFQNLEEYI